MESPGEKEQQLGAGALLLGGKGRRLGEREKHRLLWRGKTFFQWVLNPLKERFDSIYISGRSDQDLSVEPYPVVPDQKPSCGPLGGILSTLEFTPKNWVFFAACDMPLLQGELIDLMVSRFSSPFEALIPRDEKGRWMPVCAIYHRQCLPKIQEQYQKGDLRLLSLVESLQVRELAPSEWREVDPQGLSFKNINTPEDYQWLVNFSSPGG